MNDGGRDYATYTNAEYLGLRDEYETRLAAQQAVIEAARKLMRHVRTEIEVDRKTNETLFNVMIQPSKGRLYGATFEETDDDFPDTLLGTLAGLRAALDAHDEATAESETP